MRIIIDMQGAQTESRRRGIGRYSLSLALAIARARAGHDIILALNGLLSESIEPIRQAFAGLLPRENIRTWNALGPTRELEAENSSRRAIAERMREAFLLSLNPDVVLVTSLFEGLGDEGIVSIGTLGPKIPTAVILYDLIPLISPDINFRSSSLYQGYYARKIDSLRNADHLLAISGSAREEAVGALAFAPERITNIGGACDISFKQIQLSGEERNAVHRKFGISGPFLLYTGGADERKNLVRLISAFAKLAPDERQHHQLVMAGHMPVTEVDALRAHAARNNLTLHDLLFTGYISDAELLVLYNSCKLFVFPSTHEGFGIPPLEAMSCGAAVIGANSTSLPEVIGLAEAMFNPESVDSIRDKIHQALTDASFRERLLANGRVQSRAFSWDRSADKALQALTSVGARASNSGASLTTLERTTVYEQRRKKILLLQLDQLGDFVLALPAVSKLKSRYPDSSIEIATSSASAGLAKTLPYFDKIHVLDILDTESRGQTVVEAARLQEFFSSIGTYDLAIDLREPSDTRFILQSVPAQVKVGYQTFDSNIDENLDIALPVIGALMDGTPISSRLVALIDALPQAASDFISVPPTLLGQVKRMTDAIAIFPKVGNETEDWDVPHYLALVERLRTEADVREINIYFASQVQAARHPFETAAKVHSHAALHINALMESVAGNSVCIAYDSNGAQLASCLGLTAIRINGDNETAAERAPVLPKGYAIDRNAASSSNRINGQADTKEEVFSLDDVTVEHVHRAVMQAVRGQPIDVAPARPTPKGINRELLTALAPLTTQLTDAEVAEVARCITANIRTTAPGARIFVDISELAQRDSRTGIQRVTRSILKVLLEQPPQGYEIVPVYATTQSQGYLIASAFLKGFFPASKLSVRADEIADFYAGDIFLGLDFQSHVVPAQKRTLDAMHRNGVKVLFVVYDLLTVQMPHYFMEGSAAAFSRWLETIACYDGALCISKAVADDMDNYMRANFPQRAAIFDIDWFHIAADIASSAPSGGLPPDASRVLKTLKLRPTFLTVGTIEPRKGHGQTLDAFELLWAQGCDLNLAIVGKQGWLRDALAERLRNHREAGTRLFWLESTSDEYLEAIYAASTCLIAPSEGEGFGLPLIEAARHKVPIIARDLPVFREVATTHAYYFHGLSPDAIARAVQAWLELFKQQSHPQSDAMPWRTWRQTTQDLMALVRRGDAAGPSPSVSA